MSKRVSDEERIINYFHSSDLVGANVLYRVVTAAMKERNAAATVADAPKPIRRRTRKSRTALGSSPIAPAGEQQEA